jgi:hypothetical protein
MTDPNGAAIYGVPWINHILPSQYSPVMLAYIPAPAGSVVGMVLYGFIWFHGENLGIILCHQTWQAAGK